MKNRWFRFFGMDFLASPKVIPMSIPERGAYLQLLILAWDDPDCSLPKQTTELKRLAMWDEKLWGSFDRVRACFARHPGRPDRLYNARLYEEWEYCRGKSKSAQKSAFERWHKDQEVPKPKPRVPARSGAGFESISAITDKHFPPK